MQLGWAESAVAIRFMKPAQFLSQRVLYKGWNWVVPRADQEWAGRITSLMQPVEDVSGLNVKGMEDRSSYGPSWGT